MHTASLRKVGGSIMLAVPKAFLEQLHLSAGSIVSIEIEQGRLVIEPKKRRRYSLDELLSQCDPDAEISDEDRDWLDSPIVGRELV